LPLSILTVIENDQVEHNVTKYKHNW